MARACDLIRLATPLCGLVVDTARLSRGGPQAMELDHVLGLCLDRRLSGSDRFGSPRPRGAGFMRAGTRRSRAWALLPPTRATQPIRLNSRSFQSLSNTPALPIELTGCAARPAPSPASSNVRPAWDGVPYTRMHRAPKRQFPASSPRDRR